MKPGIALGTHIDAESTDGCWESMVVVDIDVRQCLNPKLRRTGPRSGAPIMCTDPAAHRDPSTFCMPFQNYGRHDYGFTARASDGASGFFSYDDEGKIWRRAT